MKEVLGSPRNPKQEVQALQDTIYVIGGKWKLPIINSLCNGNRRFMDIERSIPGISPRMLSRELKELEANQIIRRTADPEFDAQSVGAVRIGARSFYEIGPGATVLFRANYLAAPTFSGGGHASFSIDLGLGLDVRLAGRLHGTAGYTFQRISRKTNPGGTGEIDAPIQATVARVGLAVGF